MHFLHSFIHEGQFVQLVGATFGHNCLCIFAQEFFTQIFFSFIKQSL
jgi:hypothetical protein